MILVNGARCEVVDATDRGLAYGDGVFRTLAARDGRPQHWTRHHAKLRSDCAALGIGCPDEALLRGEIGELTRHQADAAVKIIVTRGPGERGYAFAGGRPPARIVMTASLPRYPADFGRSGVRVRLCSTRLGHQPALAGIKHLNRLENVLARAEWSDPAVAEGVLLDAEGNVIGGTMTNVFIAESGSLITPDLSQCGVAGVTRERALEASRRHGIPCRVERISYDRLLRAEEAFLVNSLVGLWPIRELDDRTWTPGAAARQMAKWLDEGND